MRAPEDGEGPPILTISAGAAELYALPWELVTLPGNNRYLADLPHLLLRYEWPGLSEAPLPEDTEDGPPRVILAWSAAGGGVPAAEHLRGIRDAIDRGRMRGVELEEVARVSGPKLEEVWPGIPRESF